MKVIPRKLFRTLTVAVCIIAGVLLTQCKNNAVGRELNLVDSLLVKDMVDSAKTRIDEMDISTISTKSDSALYYLLYTEIVHRLGVRDTNDSSIIYSVQYYQRSNDIKCLARAYYYEGVALYGLSNQLQAIECLKQAEYLADKTNDMVLQHKVFESLSYFNSLNSDYPLSVHYAHRALGVAKKMKDKEREVAALLYLAGGYSRLGLKDSLAICIQQCQPLINFLKDSEKAYLYTRMGELYADDEPELAKSYLKKAIAIHPQSWTLRALSDIYTKENNIAEANKVWDMALAFKGGTKARTSILKAMRRHYAQIKDFQKANTVADSIIALQQRYYEDQERDRIAEIQAKYDKEQAVVLFRAKYTKWISAAIIMLLLVISVLLYKSYRGMKAEKELAEQERDLEHLRQERCELNEEKRQNEEERSRLEEKIAELRGYEQQTADLQRQLDETNKQLDDIGAKETEHKNEIEHLQQKINDLGARHSGILARGKELYGQIEQGGTTSAWSRNDFVDYIEYYKLLDISFINHLETDYDGLSPKYTFFALLEQQGKTDEQIMNIMGISENTMRSTRSRIRGKQISPTA